MAIAQMPRWEAAAKGLCSFSQCAFKKKWKKWTRSF
jgi:hypothetical protein